VTWREAYRSESVYLSKWDEKYDAVYRKEERTWRQLVHDDCRYEELCMNKFPLARRKPARLCWRDFYEELDSGVRCRYYNSDER
jgi:hypothetical protein